MSGTMIGMTWSPVEVTLSQNLGTAERYSAEELMRLQWKSPSTSESGGCDAHGKLHNTDRWLVIRWSWSEWLFLVLVISLSRFPGFSKSGPELYLLCKQLPKGKEKLPIYVGFLPTKYSVVVMKHYKLVLHYYSQRKSFCYSPDRQTQEQVLFLFIRNLFTAFPLFCQCESVCMQRSRLPYSFILCSDWGSWSSVVLPRNSARLHSGRSEERLKDVRPQELHRVPNHTQRKWCRCSWEHVTIVRLMALVFMTYIVCNTLCYWVTDHKPPSQSQIQTLWLAVWEAAGQIRVSHSHPLSTRQTGDRWGPDPANNM